MIPKMIKIVWVPTEGEAAVWEAIYGLWPHGPYHNCPSCNPIRIHNAGLAKALECFQADMSREEMVAMTSEARSVAAAQIARGE